MKNSVFFRRVCLAALFAMVLASQTMAAEFHATNATDFQNALTTAQSNGQDDTIYLAAGTYGGNFTYLPPETEHKSLTITGEPGTCAKDIVLDGQNGGTVLRLFDWDEGDVAEITVEGITVVNGESTSSSGGIHALLASYNITIKDCIIRNNTGSRNGGGIYMLNQNTPPLTLTLENNRILNNTIIEDESGVCQGGGVLMGSRKGTYIIRNNIIAKNIAQGTTDPSGGGINAGWHYDDVIHLFGNTIYGNQAGKGGGIFVQNGNTANVYNNIVYGNTASEGGDMHLAGVETNNGYNNNYSSMFGSWTTSNNNMNTYPLFVSTENNDYHLRPNSPMVNAGKSDVPSPPGLPVTDFEGDPRSYGEAPDIGADEYAGDKYYPEEGTFGTEIAFLGSGFGSKKGKVLVGSSALKVLEWKGETIQCQLAKALPSGVYGITIQPKGTASILLEDAFTVVEPEIGSVNPTSGSTNDEIVIGGLFFGTKKGKVTLGGKNCRIKAWTMNAVTGESEIHFVVPKGLAIGTQELKVTNGVESDTVDFGVD